MKVLTFTRFVFIEYFIEKKKPTQKKWKNAKYVRIQPRNMYVLFSSVLCKISKISLQDYII